VVEDVVAFFRGHPGIDVVYGHAARVTADGRIAYYVWVPPFSYRLLKLLCFFIQPAVFLRRGAIEKRFLDESYQFAMDWELWLRLGRRRLFGRMDRVLAVDRVHPDRKMKTWLPVLEENRSRLAEAYGVQMPWYYGLVDRAYHVGTRVGGARFAFESPRDLAFSGEQDGGWTIFGRQTMSRKATWPPEFR